MSRVFVIQDQQHWDRDKRRLEPKFDLTPAKEYGEFVFLLGPNAAPFKPEGPIKEMTAKLKDYTDEDYLLLIGNPCLIGFAVALAADASDGKVRLLQWSGKERRYIPVAANLFPDL